MPRKRRKLDANTSDDTDLSSPDDLSSSVNDLTARPNNNDSNNVASNDLVSNAYRLRAGEKEKATIIAGRGYQGRDKKNFIYPSTLGHRSTNKRKGMGDQVTKDLIKNSYSDPLASSLSRAVVPLFSKAEPKKRKTAPKTKIRKAPSATQASGTEEPKADLEGQNASRNHILADSRIRYILEQVFKQSRMPDGEPGLTDAQRDAMAEFLSALAGDHAGPAFTERFESILASGRHDKLDALVHEVCEGRANLRIGLADINIRVSNEFDPVVFNRRMAWESARVYDAVLNLGEKQLIDTNTVIDALAITKDKATHQDVTSTVLSSTNMNVTGSRTEIDLAARPPNRASLVRRQSIGTTSESKFSTTVKAPAKEWHHPSQRTSYFSDNNDSNTDLSPRRNRISDLNNNDNNMSDEAYGVFSNNAGNTTDLLRRNRVNDLNNRTDTNIMSDEVHGAASGAGSLGAIKGQPGMSDEDL